MARGGDGGLRRADYRLTDPVTRAQMAVFLVGTFDLPVVTDRTERRIAGLSMSRPP